MKRLLATFAFLFGGFTTELLKPVNCNLIHRPPRSSRAGAKE
jgi:hypothetical protein